MVLLLLEDLFMNISIVQEKKKKKSEYFAQCNVDIPTHTCQIANAVHTS